VQDADDLDTRRYGPIKNDILANRKAAQAFFKFVTRTAEVRVASQGLKFLVNEVNKGIGPSFIICRNVIPLSRIGRFGPGGA